MREISIIITSNRFSQPTDNNFHSLLEFEDKDKTLTPELLSKLSSLFGSKLNVSKSEICIREVINEELKYTKKQIKPKEKKIAQLTSELFNLEQKLASNHQNNSNSIIISKVDNSNNDELFLQNLFYRTVNSFSKSIIQISEQKQTIKTKSVEYFEKWAMIANRRQKERENEQLLKKLLQEEKVARDQLLAQKTYECPICYSDYPIENIYRLDGCYHSYCRDCLQNHFKLKISERQLRKIDCPDPTCKVIITPSQIKHLVSVDDYQKYEAFLLQDALEEIPNLRWCPKRDCGNAMIGDPFSPMMICTNPQCVFSFCFNCKEEWHADATCAQYQQWKIENSEGEARYAEWIRLNAKACPKCKSFIEKNGLFLLYFQVYL